MLNALKAKGFLPHMMNMSEFQQVDQTPTTTFISNDDRGCWVNIRRYRQYDGNAPRILLLPMFHIADKAYLNYMTIEMWKADIVLLEGAAGPLARMAKLVRKLITNTGRFGLTREWAGSKSNKEDDHYAEEIGDWAHATPHAPIEKSYRIRETGRIVRFIKSDLSAGEVHASTNGLPILFWLLAPFVLTAFGIYASLKMTRRDFSDNAGTDSLHDWKDEKDGSWKRKLYDYLIRDREARIFSILDREITNPLNRGKTIAVRWGAGHMDAIRAWLKTQHGCYNDSDLWVLAIEADDTAQETSSVPTPAPAYESHPFGPSLAYNVSYQNDERSDIQTP